MRDEVRDLFFDVVRQYSMLPDEKSNRAYWLVSDETAELIYAGLVEKGIIDAPPTGIPGMQETMFGIPVIRTEGRIRLVVEV